MSQNGERDPLLSAAGSQHTADAQMLARELGSARGELACLKIAYYGVKAEIDLTFSVAEAQQGSKSEKLGAISRLIARADANCSKLQAMYEDIADGQPIPLPSKLAVL